MEFLPGRIIGTFVFGKRSEKVFSKKLVASIGMKDDVRTYNCR